MQPQFMVLIGAIVSGGGFLFSAIGAFRSAQQDAATATVNAALNRQIANLSQENAKTSGEALRQTSIALQALELLSRGGRVEYTRIDGAIVGMNFHVDIADQATVADKSTTELKEPTSDHAATKEEVTVKLIDLPKPSSKASHVKSKEDETGKLEAPANSSQKPEKKTR